MTIQRAASKLSTTQKILQSTLMMKLLATPPGSSRNIQSPSFLSADRETPHSPSPTSKTTRYGIEDCFHSLDAHR
ncbi:hypothetical protein TNCV_678031 [Trichonephila clavipes]|nr:hypothetical protein TNCV_678031 [Trichonephila clavipes]